jgi:PEGA domain
MVRLRRIGASALLACCLALSSTPARGQATNEKVAPAYVLSIWTDDADDQAEALTRALRSRVRAAAGWSVSETTQSFETLAIALRCPPKPDPACLDRIGDQLHANLYIWGKMAKGRGEITAEVHLWRRNGPGSDDSATYPEAYTDPDDPRLRAIAAHLFDDLAGPAPGATLVVRAGTGGGSVFVDGVRRGALTGGVASVAVSAGAHRVEVRVPGFQPATQSATVGATGDQKIDFTLSPAFAHAEPARVKASSPSPTRTIFGVSAIIVGAASLVVAGLEGLKWADDKRASNNDRANVPSDVTDVCANQVNSYAQDACQKSADAKTASTLGWIFAAAGVVFGGTGALLLATAPHERVHEPTGTRTSRRRPVELVPTLGTRTQSLDLRIRF